MIFKQIISLFLIYFIVIAQSSFFPFFLSFNLGVGIVLIVNLYESPQKNFGIILSFFTGFFLDIFSSYFFGFYLIFLLLISFLIKYIIKKNVFIPFTEKI